MSAVSDMVERLVAAGVAPGLAVEIIDQARALGADEQRRATSHDNRTTIARQSHDNRTTPRNRNGLTPDEVLAVKRARDRKYQQDRRAGKKSCDSKKRTSLSLTSLPEKEIQQERKEESVSARARASRLPIGWTPSADLWDFAVAMLGAALAQHTLEIFRDHWLSAAGARGRKNDWDATWRVWVRREAERRGTGPPFAPAQGMLPIFTVVGTSEHAQRSSSSDWRPGGFARKSARAKAEIRLAAGVEAEQPSGFVREENGSRDP